MACFRRLLGEKEIPMPYKHPVILSGLKVFGQKYPAPGWSSPDSAAPTAATFAARRIFLAQTHHAAPRGQGHLCRDRAIPCSISKELDEAWLLGRINRAIGRCPTIVHGAEENGSTADRWFNRALYWLGAAPPYYRFLPVFLRLPPLPSLRARNTSVGLTASEHRR